MRKVVRLTENELIRIVRRVINEQSGTGDQEKYQKLYNAVSGLGTDENTFLATIQSIKDKNEYDRINAIARSKGEDIPTLFFGDFSDTDSTNKFCTKLNTLQVPLPKSCNISFNSAILGRTNQPQAPRRNNSGATVR